MARIKLYHLSPRCNHNSIYTNGLDPKFAKTKVSSIWLCDSQRIGWALKHVSAHQGFIMSDMNIYSVNVFREKIRMFRIGIYLCNTKIPPEEICLS